jgi:predicted PurR-regulated permease PerM
MNETKTDEAVIKQQTASNEALATAAVEASLSTRNVIRTILLVLAILFVITVAAALIYWLRGLILLIVLAIFFGYLLAPLIDLIQSPALKRNRPRLMPRVVAIAIVYLMIFVMLWISLSYLLPVISDQISQLTEQVPSYANQISERFRDMNRRYQRTPLPASVRERIETSLSELSTTVGGYITGEIGAFALSFFSFLPYLVLIPIFGFFFLKDAQLFRLAAVRALPKGPLRGRAELFFHDVNKTLAAYVRAQLISCVLIGTICTAAFYLFGVQYALLLGILAAVLEFIPLVGPLTVGVIATTVASFHSSRQAFMIAGFLLVLRIIHDYVTYPRIVRKGIHLHPLAIILAVLAGEEMAGITGIFLSIPTVAIATVAYRHLLEHRGSDGIVSELLDEGKTEKAIDVAEQKLENIHQEAVIKRDAEQIEKAVSENVSEETVVGDNIKLEKTANDKITNEKVASADKTVETSGD